MLVCTCALEHSGVAAAVSLGERLHHAVDLLSFTGQPEAPEELSESLDQVQVRELVQLQEGVQNRNVEIISAQQGRTHMHAPTAGRREQKRASTDGRSSVQMVFGSRLLDLFVHY